MLPSNATMLYGYDLMLRCTKCGLRKRIQDFPSAMNLTLGTILETPHIEIFEKGCLRCGTCRFEVMSMPNTPVEPLPPVGWVQKKVPT